MIAYGPDDTPKVTPELLALADKLGCKIVHVSLSPPNPKPGDVEGKSFMALTQFIPRVGELIRTQDERVCKVKLVVHTVSPFPHDGPAQAFTLVPSVLAELVG